VQTDAYQTTGCYNLLCSGFIQTNSRIAMGAAISPTSAYNAGQFDISLLVWKVTIDHGLQPFLLQAVADRAHHCASCPFFSLHRLLCSFRLFFIQQVHGFSHRV
jgi:hypothetical protein